jgi:transketolase
MCAETQVLTFPGECTSIHAAGRSPVRGDQMVSAADLEATARGVRKRLVRMIYEAQGGHIGGSLSCVDLLVSLYFGVMRYDPSNPGMSGRDRFILSKGHSVEALYCVLARAGYFPEERLSEYGSFGTMLHGHPTMKVPGVEIPSGSLGHGLSVGVGMALAAARDRARYRVYVLMGDGELAEGSIWEAAMAGAKFGLEGLVAIIDSNNLQITGSTDAVMKPKDLAGSWRSLGWVVQSVDGHDCEAITRTLRGLPLAHGCPTMIIANTVKGRGVSFMENQAVWHHRKMSAEEYEAALRQLESAQGGRPS